MGRPRASKAEYQCPLCGMKTDNSRRMILHALEDTRKKTQFQCSRCGLTKDRQHQIMLEGPEHACKRDGKNFPKLGPKIEPEEVRSLVEEVGWRSVPTQACEETEKADDGRGSERGPSQLSEVGGNCTTPGPSAKNLAPLVCPRTRL
jgi:predicted RNA-binding Zn-ribbon protein involved in translation (DUF1610 family)